LALSFSPPHPPKFSNEYQKLFLLQVLWEELKAAKVVKNLSGTVKSEAKEKGQLIREQNHVLAVFMLMFVML
jgi:hypothetical protein